METEPIRDAILPAEELVETPIASLLSQFPLEGGDALPLRIWHLLRTLIVNLRLLPNQFLPEKEVAAALSVSKTPVREAFIRLANEGLVAIVPKRGTYVSPIDIKRALRGYFIRESIESACARRIALECGPDALSVLDRELSAQRDNIEAGDFDTFYLLDNKFHDVLYDIADMPRAKRLVESVKPEVDRIKGLKSVYRFCHPEAVLLAEHTAIRDAVAQRDARRAAQAVRNHLSGMNEAIQAILKEEKLWGLFRSINRPPARTEKA